MPRERFDRVRAFARATAGNPVHMTTVWEYAGRPTARKGVLVDLLRERHGIEAVTVRGGDGPPVPWIVRLSLIAQPPKS